MLRIRTAALSFVAAGAVALTLGVAAGPAVAHDFGHHGFWGHHHALTGVVQSVDTTNNTAVITLGGGDRAMHRDWDHGGSNSSTQQVTLDLSGASIFDAASMQKQCHGPSGTSTATPSSVSAIQPGDMVTAKVAVDHSTARQDVASGTAVPVSKLIDWGQKSTSGSDQSQQGSGSDARRFASH
jgi:hypothetical protein